MATYAIGPTGVDLAFSVGGNNRTIGTVTLSSMLAHVPMTIPVVDLNKVYLHKVGASAPIVVTYYAWPVQPTTGQLWPRGGWPGH